MIKRMRAFYVLRGRDMNVWLISMVIMLITVIPDYNYQSWHWSLNCLLAIFCMASIAVSVVTSIALLFFLFLILISNEDRKRLNSAMIYLGYTSESSIFYGQYDKEYLEELKDSKEERVKLL